MQCLPIRLRPGDDLRPAIEAAVAAHGGAGAFVLAGIGSLDGASLRLAGAEQLLRLDGDLEILTLAGSVSADGSHLHMSVADAQGRVWGGHVTPGCIVRTTAELLLALLPPGQLGRAFDPATGYTELVVRPPG
ncbi:PPC domain-containing DNA-binding protein [Rivibacter subsaxonicus]|uniref:PPC domain-containing protein n=1 Tax=Rivibacter subsaxonicus TaxID=457575 RepID=A0A4Q7W1G4_9BURK|nr:PPC domain-containing DNA-binding protein [Rivibacter subsaxonicus]RZU02748.1 hypothetical protein EV670_0777 [Rivibacter subsaxonicus]